jgi:hypothetical protein
MLAILVAVAVTMTGMVILLMMTGQTFLKKNAEGCYSKLKQAQGLASKLKT